MPCSPAVQRAVAETAGEMLTFDGAVCDSRFYKCCGSRTVMNMKRDSKAAPGFGRFTHAGGV